MKNRDLWEGYTAATKQTSSNIRWLVGGMFSWVLFKGNPATTLVFLLYLILLLDILQYFIDSLILKFWTQKKEKENYKKHNSITKDKEGNEIEYEKPRWMDRPSFILWILKNILFLTTAAYFFCILFAE